MKIGIVFRAVAAALMCVVSPAAFAQEQTVSDYVRSLVADYADADETLVDGIAVVELELFDEAEFIFTVNPNKTYYVYGACDDDCYDMDLQAHDEDEIEIDYDAEEGAEPMLIIGPGDAGSELHVIVSLGDCDTDTCVVGFGVYEAIY
jgi:hypothetical protein